MSQSPQIGPEARQSEGNLPVAREFTSRGEDVLGARHDVPRTKTPLRAERGGGRPRPQGVNPDYSTACLRRCDPMVGRTTTPVTGVTMGADWPSLSFRE